MNGALVIELKDGDDGFRVIGEITRVPQERKGWAWVRYKGQRYVLRGWVRVPWFINVRNPIKGRVA